MKYKKIYIIAGAVAAFFLLYRYVHQVPIVLQNKKIPTFYDYSVRTEYGKPIKVVRVIDGDTVELVNGDRLRYIGIDTPEEVDPRKPAQCFAREAADANKVMVENKSIIFYNDISLRDKYGRWLGFVYLSGGTFVNRVLVKQGFAFAYPYKPDISRADEFQQDEAQAREARLGLWSLCKVYRDPAGREQTNNL